MSLAGGPDDSLGMEDGRMVAAAKVYPDLLKAEWGQLTSKVHCDLAWVAD